MSPTAISMLRVPRGGDVINPRSPDVEAASALALVVALLRALRDRGTLSRAELDDVLTETAGRLDGKASYLIETVRADLERTDEGSI